MNDRESNRSRNVRPETLLPMVRAAMSRGEGPPIVLAWVRSQGQAAPNREVWSYGDEARARSLAGRLAEALADTRGGDGLRTKQFGETFAGLR
jgi:hypothetical protein